MSHDPAISTFLAEAAELLGSMESVLLRCEQGSSDPEAVNSLFRAAHTFKGSAGLFGLNSIVAFTHVLESLLDRIRAERMSITPATASILLECTDHLGLLIKTVEHPSHAQDGALNEAGAALLARLTQETGLEAAVDNSQAVTAAAGAPPAEPARSLEEGTWHVSVRFRENVLRNGMDPLSFIRYLATLGTIVGLQVVDDALPTADEFDPESCYLGFEIRLTTTVDKARIEAAFDFVRDDCTLNILAPQAQIADYVQLIRDLPDSDGKLGDLLIRCGSLTEDQLEKCLSLQYERSVSTGEAPPIGELLVESGYVKPELIDAAIQKQNDARASKAARALEGRAIRVDGAKLDRLIDWIGELIVAGASTSALAREAGLPALQESSKQLAHIVAEIRDQALKLRMVQIGSTFSKFRRVVRDVARETGKNIGLQINGADTELDRTLVEGITDPLTHLVRNAIDHGIESPEVRQARGKPAIGMVRLNAYHDAGSVVIEVADDGGGLKRDRILKKAIGLGLTTEAAGLSDTEINALLFAPGFTTADSVTNLSGRGVGMDVVKRNIEALRGTVEVHSQEGHGMRVCIRLPLTLAIIDGFQVAVGSSQFIIPLSLIEECVEVASEPHLEGGVVSSHITLHDSMLPLIRLREMFDLPHRAAKRQSVVVVRDEDRRVGIVVDELHGELQAVIKPLSRLFNGILGIGGSSILGNGKVALILDIPGLVTRSHKLHRGTHAASRLPPRTSDVTSN